jgi:C4-type Zn-finger protein
MSLAQKTAYLQGLIKGRGVDDEITVLMADILGEIAVKVESLNYRTDNVEDRMDMVEDEVSDVRELTEDYFSDAYDDEADDNPPITEYDYDDEAEDEDDEGIYEITCPSCGEKLYLSDDEIEEGTIACPLCGEPLELILDEEDSDGEK